jgi:acetoin utilization protein AcuB
MLVREIMHPDPIIAGPGTTLQEAYGIMNGHRVRHLPVVEDDRVVGIVTDRDLRLATSVLSPTPFPAETSLDRVMKQPVHTVDPLDPVENAARTMRELRIGCLPVIDDDRLVGIVTGIDLLDAMLRLTGVYRPSGRIEVRLPDRPGELAKLTGILSKLQVNIQSILSYPDPNGHMRLVLRVGSIDTRPLASALCQAEIEVVWPPQHACR